MRAEFHWKFPFSANKKYHSRFTVWWGFFLAVSGQDHGTLFRVAWQSLKFILNSWAGVKSVAADIG
jgi:hypothetical protein